MKDKINVSELLKDCPKGMELDCTIFENVVFHDIIDRHFPIRVRREHGGLIELTSNGCIEDKIDAKCVIFPKGKTTWEGFHRPFKDGDVIFTHANCLKVGLGNTWISIYQENRNGGVATYVDYAEDGSDYYSDIDGDKAFLCMENDILRQRLATEEEKAKLFQAIKDNGYKWNAETKTLEKLNGPKFKVGDRIRHKDNGNILKIVDIDMSDSTYCCGLDYIWVADQDNYELVPDRFDITALKPFDKVLVRDFDNTPWEIEFFSRLLDGKHFKCFDLSYVQCIPYEGNEHLLGKKDDCNEYFKTWK